MCETAFRFCIFPILLKFKRLLRRGRCPHRPADYKPAPTAVCTRRAFSVQLDWIYWIAWSAAAAGKRGQSTVAPAPDARNNYPGSVPRNGVRADRDWCAGAPRSGPPAIFGSFHRWKEHKRENSAAPAAGCCSPRGKRTKTPLFAAPLACSLKRRAKFEWFPPFLPGHWALARKRTRLSQLLGSAWPVPYCLASWWTAGR